MNCLVTPDGRIDFGIIGDPVENVNYKDYHLESPMGRVKSRLFKTLRFHQFVFIGIIGPEIYSGLAIVDVKYLSNGFFYVYDRASQSLHETTVLSLPHCARIGTNPSCPDACLSTRKLTLTIRNGLIQAKGQDMSIDARIDLAQTDPLRLCTRTGYRGWTYTEKTAPVPISGTLNSRGKTWDLSQTLALTDWTCGFMRRNTFWNWASSACVLPDGKRLGLNLSSGVNETAFTENAFWIDNERIKVDTVNFAFNSGNLMNPWKIRSFDGKVDLEFIPETKREDCVKAFFVASRFTQLMGQFSGTLTTDSNERITLCNVPGFTEDHYAKI